MNIRASCWLWHGHPDLSGLGGSTWTFTGGTWALSVLEFDFSSRHLVEEHAGSGMGAGKAFQQARLHKNTLC